MGGAQVKSNQIAYLVGMPRAGTTFLYHNLNRHPQIFVPFRRKSNFFSLHHDKPTDWFLQHFEEMGAGQIGIDTETLHFFDRNLDSLSRIAKFNPDAKVLLVVRRPGEWVWSLYKQISTFEKEIPPFSDFLNGQYVLVEDDRRIPFNLRDGDVGRKIRQAMDTFGSNALVLNFDLLAQNPLQFLTEIENFFGIENFFRSSEFDRQKINSSDRANFRFLAHLLRQEWLIRLAGLLPRDFVVFLRRIYDSLGTSFMRRAQSDNGQAEQNIAMAREFYASDEKYTHALFKDGDVLHG